MTEPAAPRFAEVFGDDLLTDADISESALDPNVVFAEIDDGAVGELIDDGSRSARFEGDTSDLAAEVCWALQQLVAAPHVTSESKSWPVVLDNEALLRTRLSELGLVLVVNREHHYAYTRQGNDPSPRGRVVLRSKTLSLAASALALHLYQQYVVSPDDPVVERTDLEDHMLATYRPVEDTDEVQFKHKISTAIKLLVDLHILKPVNGNEDRFIIYAAITAIVTAGQVTALEAKYREIAGSADTNADTNGVRP